MFKKKERLTKAEFTECFKIGKRHHFPYVTIITSPYNSLKVAVVVGKKVAKSAVKRNLIKRRIYSLLHTHTVVNKPPKVIIVLVKPAYNALSRKEAAKEVCQSFAQVLKNT